jgi:hypothetical protein
VLAKAWPAARAWTPMIALDIGHYQQQGVQKWIYSLKNVA